MESVPLGYPLIFDALPDLDGFYREILGAPLASECEFKDLSLETVAAWSKTVHAA